MISCLRHTLVAPAILLVLLTAPGAPARAAVLPRLELIAPDRSVTNVTQLSIASGKWIFIYVHANHSASEELLRRLSKTQYAGVPQRTVIVLGGVGADGLASFTARHPQLAAALWYADPVKKTRAVLKLSGTPIILGVDNQEITWSLNGLPRDDRWTQSMFTTWVKPWGTH